MGYKLRKREYGYNESLFKEIGIQVQEVEGRNFLYQFPLQGEQMDNDGRKAIMK